MLLIPVPFKFYFLFLIFSVFYITSTSYWHLSKRTLTTRVPYCVNIFQFVRGTWQIKTKPLRTLYKRRLQKESMKRPAVVKIYEL